jgi:hypothetical protein
VLYAASRKARAQAPPVTDKSFLVLFFKKELLPVCLAGETKKPADLS